MLIARLRRLIINPALKNPKSEVTFWLSLSLIFSLIYGIMGLQEAFASEYIVQDDARQHVFWMQRFVDPNLFPDDLIADYFQSVAPVGYTALYQLMASLGIPPLLFNKFLPIGLGLITTGYCFRVCIQMLPIPATAFIASLMLNQSLSMEDDLVSGTPRAFLYPLLLAFSYYLLRRSLFKSLVAIALQGLFYPQTVFICVGTLVLQLLSWKHGRIRLSSRKSDYWFCAAGVGVALLVLLPYALKTSIYGPIVTVAQAKTLPEFLSGGRANFFDDDFSEFWFKGRSGMFSRTILTPVTFSAGLLLPIVIRCSSSLPLVRKVKSEARFLIQLTLVSFGLFFAAHALLFRLHLPSRYTEHTLRIVLALAAAIAFTILFDAVFNWAQKPNNYRRQGRQLLALSTAGLIVIAVVMYPSFLNNFPKTGYKTGNAPEIYEFFSQQPKDIMIASLAKEADNLPTFSGRSVLISREYGIPYHTGYYQQFSQRAIDLIEAHYSPNLVTLQEFIRNYRIDFWLLEEGAFTSEYLNKSWRQQFQPAATEAQTILEQGNVPALLGLSERCSVFESEGFLVVSAQCIANTR